MMKIDNIWNELENDLSFSHGLLLRRYSSEVLPDIYIALKSPEKFRCIAVSLNNNLSINFSTFSNLRDISIEISPDELNPGKHMLLFKLLSNQHRDIFSILCEDLISSIAVVIDETRLVKELLNRFEKWKSLFDRATSQGLRVEEQRGLYGELFFLRKLLHKNSDFQIMVASWVGAEKQIRDFQYGSWGVEVKTTHGNNHQKILISSERQLDPSNLENLFLYHLSLEASQNNGESLNSMVQSIFALLNDDIVSLNRFRNKLLEAGYFTLHEYQYEGIGYFIRRDDFYKVEQMFPRIEESEIRKGVGDVKYSIIVSQCFDYIRTEEEVLRILGF